MPVARRSPPLALAGLALAGCFVDPGLATTQAADATAPGASTSTQGPTDPGTSGTTPGDPSAPTSAGASETGGACEQPGACEPGAVELSGVACDPCGRVERTCQDDCTWADSGCVASVDACAYWVYTPLAVPGGAWTAQPRPTPTPLHAPAGAIAAAVELAQHGQALALAADSFHLLHADGTWSASGPLGELFPDLGMASVSHAFGRWDPAQMDYFVTLLVGDVEHRYRVTADPLGVTVVDSGPFTPAGAPDLALVRDVFYDPGNTTGWGEGDVAALCGLPEPTPLGYFAAWVGPEQVWLQDQGYCLEFLAPPVPTARFGPFGAAGAPPAALIGGVALVGERLYVFAGG